MKLLVIIFFVSLFINVLLRNGKYDLEQHINGTVEIVQTILVITFFTSIISFIWIVIIW